MKFNTDEVMKEFDELVNEVRRDMPDPDDPNAESNWEGPIRRFGQRVLRDDEFFTITDFGNIKAFFTAKLQEAWECGEKTERERIKRCLMPIISLENSQPQNKQEAE